MTAHTLSSATAAKICMALTILPSPVSATVGSVTPVALDVSYSGSASLFGALNNERLPTQVTSLNEVSTSEASRATTANELLIGEIRQYTLLGSNWDGEDSDAPGLESVGDAVNFARLMDASMETLEPMLLATGNVSLYVNKPDYYAEVEFLGGQRLAYFIKTVEGRHKGVVDFNSKKMPAVLKTLLQGRPSLAVVR
jgi:hypothetical protein